MREWKKSTAVTAELIGALAGYAFSQGKGENVSSAASIAKSAYENNYLKHDEWDQYISALAKCGSDAACKENVHKAALQTSLANRHLWLMCRQNGNCEELRKEIEFLTNGQADAAIKALQNLAYYEARNPNVTHDDIASSSVADLVSGNTDDYITYADFYASRCAGVTVQTCVVAFSTLAEKVATDSARENLAVVAGISGAMLAPLLAPAALGAAAAAGATISETGTGAYVLCVTSQLCTGTLSALAALDLGAALKAYYDGDPHVLGVLVTTAGINGIASFADDLASLVRVGKIAGPSTATIGGKTCVYSCVVDGTTRYVGITDDVARRGAEHLAQKGIKIQEIRGLENLSRADARAVEQTLINYYGLGKNGGTLLNKINSISATKNTTAYEQALIRGKQILDSVNYHWTN